ncbi:hypothetical protein GCM10023329_21250 [Streptomyces sanyensis]|uniref:Uncharacterized protein n=1 Tax=Streptomyces sanyensis TaxID=568869 RepID=A0ABP9A3C3_9ACTN
MRCATFGWTLRAARGELHVCRVFLSGITHRGSTRPQGEHPGEVARLDRGAVLRGEDQSAGVLPEFPGGFPVTELLGGRMRRALRQSAGSDRKSSTRVRRQRTKVPQLPSRARRVVRASP